MKPGSAAVESGCRAVESEAWPRPGQCSRELIVGRVPSRVVVNEWLVQAWLKPGSLGPATARQRRVNIGKLATVAAWIVTLLQLRSFASTCDRLPIAPLNMPCRSLRSPLRSSREVLLLWRPT